MPVISEVLQLLIVFTVFAIAYGVVCHIIAAMIVAESVTNYLILFMQ
jgi:phage shock protein PspC (stress-responsive transcriptional regulator)